VGEAQQPGQGTFEGFAGLGGVAEVSGCCCSVAEHDVVRGREVWLGVAGGGERVADERVKPGAVGEHGTQDRAVWVFELRGRVDESAPAKAGVEELRGDVGSDRAENVAGFFGGFLDAGPLKRARELEAMGLLHMTLQGTLGTGFSSALKVLA
jgi:hypothetical protein